MRKAVVAGKEDTFLSRRKLNRKEKGCGVIVLTDVARWNHAMNIHLNLIKLCQLNIRIER